MASDPPPRGRPGTPWPEASPGPNGTDAERWTPPPVDLLPLPVNNAEIRGLEAGDAVVPGRVTPPQT
jgi:hypothetical protein